MLLNSIQCALSQNLRFTRNSSTSMYANSTFVYFESEIFANNYTAMVTTVQEQAPHYEWYFLLVILFIFAGGLGNILVCLAIALDRKLQNVTNYFLLSLAVADLLVSLFVMPLGAIPGFLGEYFANMLSVLKI